MHPSFLVLLTTFLSQPAAPQAPRQGQAAPRVFLVPTRAQVHEKQATVEGNDVTLWLKRGAVVTAKVNVGLFFVEPGATLTLTGNVVRIVVAEGGTLAGVEGNVVHVHHAKGAASGRSTRLSIT